MPYSSVKNTGKTKIIQATRAYQFILRNRAAAFATVDGTGTPHVATVYCTVHEDLTLYFSTRVEARKFHNLTCNPTAAMTFYNEQQMTTIQMTGRAERVENLEVEAEILRDLLIFRLEDPSLPLPPVRLFEAGATNELAIIKVSPLEMTIADFKVTKTGRYHPFFHKVL